MGIHPLRVKVRTLWRYRKQRAKIPGILAIRYLAIVSWLAVAGIAIIIYYWMGGLAVSMVLPFIVYVIIVIHDYRRRLENRYLLDQYRQDYWVGRSWFYTCVINLLWAIFIILTIIVTGVAIRIVLGYGRSDTLLTAYIMSTILVLLSGSQRYLALMLKPSRRSDSSR
jgi:hypothetical protein